MPDFIYDIETYPNVFTLSVEAADSTDRWTFEISQRVNHHQHLVDFVRWLISIDARMIGFNNYGFDYPVLHYILHSFPTPAEIFHFANNIINCDPDRRFDHIIWDRDQLIPQIDLFKIHHFDNKARATSLKIIEFNSRSNNIEDLPFTPGTSLSWHEIDTLIRYNQHDVSETKKFYFETLPLIKIREELSQKYGKNFLNHNDAKIGKDYFIMKLEESSPGICFDTDRRPRQTHRQFIDLRDVIFPWIEFKRPEFIAVLDWFKNQRIYQTKGVFNDIPVEHLGDLSRYCKTVTRRKKINGALTPITFAENLNTVVNGFQFDFGTGGIHGSVTRAKFESDDFYEIVDIDVASFYPNIPIVSGLYPEHLGQMFCVIYKDVYDQRKTYKKGTAENAMLKLALNGVYGDSNNVYSPFYDPKYTMSVTINGQLLICFLADYLMDIPGLQLIQVNTDGVTVKIPRVNRHMMKHVTDWWQDRTGLVLEEATYRRMWIRDVNSYLAEYDDEKLKRKGAYGWKFDRKAGLNKGMGDLDWHQNHSALIVPMAAEAHLVSGIAVEDFILNHDDIFDFMLREKVPRSSRLVITKNGNDAPVQNITRYYVSNSGGSMVKIMPPLPGKPDKDRRIGVVVGWNVTECNDIFRAVGSDINFDYYISEAKKLII